MIYIISILIAIILIIRLLFRNNKNQLQKIDTQNIKNADKYNLITKVFLDIISQFKRLNSEFELLTNENEFLKQEFQKLEQKIIVLLEEHQTTLEVITNLKIQNNVYIENIQELEGKQKSFIQKLGGIVYEENLEDKTWDLVLVKAQLLMNERNEALTKFQTFQQENENIKQANKLLDQEKNTFNQSVEVLKSVITTKDGEINYLTQKLKVLESQVNELPSKSDHNIELEPIQNELNNLQSLIIQKDACIQTLEIEKAANLQNISLLEATITTQEYNCELLTQEKINLNNRVQQLEGEIQSFTEKLRDVELQRNTFEVSNNHSYLENIQVQIAQKDDNIQKLEIENHQNIQRIKQLEINLNNKESQLKLITQEKIDCDSYIKELEIETTVLNQNLTDAKSPTRNFNEISINNIDMNELQKLQRQISKKENTIRELEMQLEEYLEYAYIIRRYNDIVEFTEYNYSHSDIECYESEIEYIHTWAEDDFLYFTKEFFTFLKSYL